MPRTPAPPHPQAPLPDDPAQSQRFIDMARELETDECPQAFKRVLDKVIRSPQPLIDKP